MFLVFQSDDTSRKSLQESKEKGNLSLYKYLLFDNFQIEKVNTLDIEKIKSYYNQIRSEDLCDCDYCRNNIHEVKAAYSTSFIGTHPITGSSGT